LSALEILYEDDDVIAVNKPGNVFIHPMKEDRSSKENNLLYQVRDYHGEFVYAINRLDRPVSGIALFAKENESVSIMQNIWHDNTTHKKYLAMCLGEIKEAGKFDSPLSKMDISSKGSNNNQEKEYQEALTLYKPIEFFEKTRTTFMEVEILTGRYHQIRRHFRKAVHPLIGDRKHGKGPINNLFRDDYGLEQIFLHCHCLQYVCPWSKTHVEINCSLPEKLQSILTQLN
jgi:tRNA pseudouridine65 synthase